MNGFEDKVRAFILQGFEHQYGSARVEAKPDAEWKKVHEAGTALWLDTGDIDAATELWNDEFEALTTNNTLLNREIQKGIYDDLVLRAATTVRDATPGIDDATLVLEIAFILNAYHGLRLVEQFDSHVSVELHTDLAHDVDRTLYYGKRYYEICPERFIVKVPLTPAGFLGARRLRQAGIPINFTLGFSARHNYLAATLTKPSYVNVFMGRLNAFVSDHSLGDGLYVGEKVTLATQRALLALREAGSTDTRLIGASIRDGQQVGYLAGIDVQTIPTSAAAQYRRSPLAEVVRHIDDDPQITLREGVSIADFNGSTLWEVPEVFMSCVSALREKDLDALTPEALRNHFAEGGLGDFLPRWSDEEVKTITADGKIPIYEKWASRLEHGELGLDALMNLSALQSFATDQKALDDRIISLL